DLVVIDEAHELFAGIYRRYDRRGDYKGESKDALIAQRVRDAIGGAPVLLLTATPIQNSLAELWGLVQYVEPTGTLLGKLPTFRELFCDGSDRTVQPEQVQELRRRLTVVMQRTLRRQAQEFLEVPFVERQTALVEDFFHDLEEDTAELDGLAGTPAEAVPEPPAESSPDIERVRAELEQVREFARRSADLPHDSKARCLLDALRVVSERGARGQG